MLCLYETYLSLLNVTGVHGVISLQCTMSCDKTKVKYESLSKAVKAAEINTVKILGVTEVNKHGQRKVISIEPFPPISPMTMNDNI